MTFNSLQEMVQEAEGLGISLGHLVYRMEVKANDGTDNVYARMTENWRIMMDAVESGLERPRKSRSGLIGGDGAKLLQYLQGGKSICGSILEAASASLAVAEWNASMGKIVAAPTAGSAGILPGTLYVLTKNKELKEDNIVMGLFAAAGVGIVIGKKASLSGAEGGCQAECGSAAAMAAAAAVEVMGGTAAQAASSVAICLKNYLGLVCDPVAGLVEVPCAKRNALGAVQALAAADMALAGISSFIPADEVIVTMGDIGRSLPETLRETARGGLAVTPTAMVFADKYKENFHYGNT